MAGWVNTWKADYHFRRLLALGIKIEPPGRPERQLLFTFINAGHDRAFRDQFVE
jgi:hypothetical protein